MSKTWTPERVSKAIKLYQRGLNLTEVAEILGSSKSRVSDQLKKAGIARRPKAKFPCGKDNCKWIGGKRLDGDGYVLVLAKWHPHAVQGGYVLEHRLVMEQILGRFLSREEVVHHIDKNKQNNDPSNLVLFSSNGLHLGTELAGRRPNWSKDGLRRLKAHWRYCRNRPNHLR